MLPALLENDSSSANFRDEVCGHQYTRITSTSQIAPIRMSIVEVFNSMAIMQLTDDTGRAVETVVETFPESLVMYSRPVKGVMYPVSALSVQLVIGLMPGRLEEAATAARQAFNVKLETAHVHTGVVEAALFCCTANCLIAESPVLLIPVTWAIWIIAPVAAS